MAAAITGRGFGGQTGVRLDRDGVIVGEQESQQLDRLGQGRDPLLDQRRGVDQSRTLVRQRRVADQSGADQERNESLGQLVDG